MDRRQFLKYAGGASIAATSPLSHSGLLDSAFGSSVGQFATVLANAVFNDLELEYIAGAPGFPPGKVAVNHYLPVAFIEIVKSPTDSIILGPDIFSSVYAAAGSGGINTKRFVNTMNARIWNIPEFLRWALLTPLCKYCGDETAYFTPEQDISAIGSTVGAESVCAGGAAIAAGLQILQQKLIGLSPLSCMPQIYYDSTIDPNWRSGCHDLITTASIAATLGLSWEAGCESGAGEIIGKIASKFGLTAGDSINPCINSYGPLFPRQDTSHAANPTLAAAITAYRALHLAAYLYGTFPMKVGLSGKFKLVYPVTGTPAFDIGSSVSKLALSEAPLSATDERFGFIYLTPVTCSKIPWSTAGLCAPLPPCTGSGSTGS